MNAILVVALATVVVLNLFAMFEAMRAGTYTVFQVIAQIVLIWVFPLFGAVTVVFVARHDREPKPGPVDIDEYARIRDTHNDNATGF